MTDIDKMIDGLTKARNYLDTQQRTYESVFHACNGSEIKVNAFDERIAAIDEAINRLKKQEPIEPIKLHMATTTFHKEIKYSWLCPNCGGYLIEMWKACPTCGRKLKWR